MTDSSSTKTRRRIRWWSAVTRRRLICGTIVLGCLTAWIGKPLTRVIHQRYVVAQIQSLGGDVGYNYDFDDEKQTLNEKVVWLFFGDQTFAKIDSALLTSDRPMTDDDYALLTSLPNIEHLYLQGHHITDDVMKYAAKLPHLETLGIVTTNVTPNGMAELSIATELDTLMFGMDDVSDDMLDSIAKLTGVSSIGFKDTKLTTNGFERLTTFPHLRQLAVMDSSMTSGVPDLSIENRQHIERLFLFNVTITVDGKSERLNFDYDSEEPGEATVGANAVPTNAVAFLNQR